MLVQVLAFNGAVRLERRSSSLLSMSSSSVLQSEKGLSYDLDAWRVGFTSCEEETAAVLEGGNIPMDLKGTYFKNGHALFEVGRNKQPIIHPFDADGMITAVNIEDGKATFRNRYVGTDGYKKERKGKGVMFRGAFGSKREGGVLANIFDLKQKNVANTNVIYWAGRLLALWEGGLPHRMEPDSLRTLGAYTFKGLLPKSGNFGAHPRIDSNTGRLINFSRDQKTTGKTECTISVYEFEGGTDSIVPIKQRDFTIPGLPFFHDFVVTKNFYVFNRAPTTFDPIPFVLGQKGPAECIGFDASQAAIVYLVPRDGSDIIEVEVDAHFNFHFANGFEDEEGNINFDVVKCDSMQLGNSQNMQEPLPVTVDYAKDVPYSKLVRYTFSADSNSKSGYRYSTRELSKTQVDFVSVAPGKSCLQHKFVYAASGSDLTQSSPIQGLVKIDCDAGTETKWIGERHEYLGESIFVAKEGAEEEDDGYLMSFLLNGRSQTTEFVIFDAKDVAQGPISRQLLPTKVPFGLHGNWVPDLTFDPEAILRRHKACKALDSKAWNTMTGGFSGLGITQDMYNS
jgi:all-trans-8'-apo-beta-carotenal 15,15'-oxygenase